MKFLVEDLLIALAILITVSAIIAISYGSYSNIKVWDKHQHLVQAVCAPYRVIQDVPAQHEVICDSQGSQQRIVPYPANLEILENQ